MCTNKRTLPKQGCANLTPLELCTLLKEKIAEHNIQAQLRVNQSGCLGQCKKGPVMVVYPKGKWYFGENAKDINHILDDMSIDAS